MAGSKTPLRAVAPGIASNANPNLSRRVVVEHPRLGTVKVTVKGGVPSRAIWSRSKGRTNFLIAHWSPDEFAALMDELGIAR